MRKAFRQEFLAFLECEQTRRFLRIPYDRNDEGVKVACRTLDDVEVAKRDGIKTPRDKRN